ncbi:MAG: LCP family protein [Eubacteriales bacterium]|nr:LCP family protein [Eubacteriales bacterium]
MKERKRRLAQDAVMPKKTSIGSTISTFIKFFLVWLLLFTAVMIPGRVAFAKMGETRIFAGTENLMDEMDTLVDPNSPFFEAFQDSQRVNVLLIGLNDELSDVIMLGSYDMENQHVDVISMPRDTYYDRPEANSPATRKINAIYRNGTAVGTAEAVSDILMGIPIHYYATISYDGIGNIVDAVGGVPMEIPFHMHYEDPTDKPPLYIDFAEGSTILDSSNVQEFLRFRKGSPGYPGYPEGDIGRVKAHQEFIKSAFRESLGLGLPKVAKTVLNNVESDLDLGIALKITKKAAGLSAEDIETYLTPGDDSTVDGASYWFVDEEGIEEMLRDIYQIGEETEAAEGSEEQTEEE